MDWKLCTPAKCSILGLFGYLGLTADHFPLNISIVKSFTGPLVAFSLIFSASFSGIDVESIATFIHILELDYGDHKHHEETSKERSFRTHHHNVGSQEDEPHEHTVNLVSSFTALQNRTFTTNWLAIDLGRYIPPYIQNQLSSPDLDGLYRPPKC